MLRWPKRFVLTADDLAFTPGVTRGIIALLEANRISATGAMTNRPHWPEASRAIAPFWGRADIGVHLNLTAGAPLTRMGLLAPSGELPKLPVILRAGLLGSLPLDEIGREFDAQLTAFEDRAGQMPDFVDGHQHVHALPGVRRALATVLARRYTSRKPYLRDPGDRMASIRQRARYVAKAGGLAMLAQPFARRMRDLGFALNEGFSGYSAFDAEGDYAADFATYLKAPGTRHLVMCHPGEIDEELRTLDPATHSRPRETEFFLSGQFQEICQAASLEPARFSELEPMA
ncbi:chbG Chitooligosaccharide deacetylase [Rhabdaerophilaceae bacterium]